MPQPNTKTHLMLFTNPWFSSKTKTLSQPKLQNSSTSSLLVRKSSTLTTSPNTNSSSTMTTSACNQEVGLVVGKDLKATHSGKATTRKTPTHPPSWMVSRIWTRNSILFILNTLLSLTQPRSPSKEKSTLKVSKPWERTWMPRTLWFYQLLVSHLTHKWLVISTFLTVRIRLSMKEKAAFGGQVLTHLQLKATVFKWVSVTSIRVSYKVSKNKVKRFLWSLCYFQADRWSSTTS